MQCAVTPQSQTQHLSSNFTNTIHPGNNGANEESAGNDDEAEATAQCQQPRTGVQLTTRQTIKFGGRYKVEIDSDWIFN